MGKTSIAPVLVPLASRVELGQAALEPLDALEQVVQTCPCRGGGLDRIQRQSTHRADELAAAARQECFKAPHSRLETLELSAQDRWHDVGDAALDVAREGLRLPDQRLAAAGQDASDRTERAARRFVLHPLHRDLLLPLVPTARPVRASGPRESNRSHVTSARIAVESARAPLFESLCRMRSRSAVCAVMLM